MAITQQTLRQVRDLSLDLRPSLLDDLGLGAALRWYLDRQGSASRPDDRPRRRPSRRALPGSRRDDVLSASRRRRSRTSCDYANAQAVRVRLRRKG